MNTLLAASLIELSVGVACLLVAVAAVPYRSRPGGTPLVLLAVGGGAWAATAAAASLIADPALTMWAQRGTYAATGFVSLCWFYVVVEYTRRVWWSRPTVLAAVAGLLALDWLVLATDPIHRLVIAEPTTVSHMGAIDPMPGVLLWVTAAWKIAFLVAGIGFVTGEFATHRGVYRQQSLAMIAAGVLPLGAALVEVLDLIAVPGLDIGVIGVAASSVVAFWALFYTGFLDAVPIARRSLFVSMADAVVAVDERDRVVDINETARTVLGADEHVLGSDAAAVIPTEALACEDGESVAVPLTREGARRRYEASVSPIRVESVPDRPKPTDEQIGRLFVLRDVTEQHERQLTLAAQNERLEEFSSVLSHDLRNPLNVAQGHLELARATGGDEHFDAVDRALGRIGELTDDLLALARAGTPMADAEDIHLAELVGECWATVLTDGATLVVDTDLVMSADRLRLKQLFENLFRNAIEHGGATVTVTVGEVADGAGFYVADDGPGVPASDRELVFESGHSTLVGNTGLGLAIVKQAAEAHGWTVRLTDSETGGARFEFAPAA